ncbi:MAG TPA: adenylosuccinate lyase [Candidatus Paceibacterota bacterium]
MPLNSISPIDGRYAKNTEPLSAFMSEQALMKYRLMVEGEYFIALSDLKLFRKLSGKEKDVVRSLYELEDSDAKIISDIEIRGYKDIKATDHDVKAVEYYIKDRLGETSLKDALEWVHFAITSEDTNNIAYALMLSDSLQKVLIPKIEEVVSGLDALSKKYKDLPMLARTHGQSASPTTFGKEMRVFSSRVEKRLEGLKSIRIQAKLNGATGNYNAHVAAFPKVNWMAFSKKFIDGFNKNRTQKLEANLVTTQIECHDNYVAVFDTIRSINTILLDLNQDMWRYISDDWVVQKPAEGTVGSSTMPHKINPIKFENSEGNLGMANSMFEFFARKLPVSRLQRDLSDSTVARNFGSAFAHSLVAYEYLLKGLRMISINEDKIKEELRNHPEVIAEAVQTILRREGEKMPYEKLKKLTRGKKITLTDIHDFIKSLQISDKVKRELLKITPENYTGLASKLASK